MTDVVAAVVISNGCKRLMKLAIAKLDELGVMLSVDVEDYI